MTKGARNRGFPLKRAIYTTINTKKPPISGGFFAFIDCKQSDANTRESGFGQKAKAAFIF